MWENWKGHDECAGLIVLYRWKIAEADLPRFRECWAGATDELRDFGAMGSLLAKDSDGDYWAIARWPDRVTRDKAEETYIDSADWPPALRMQTVLLNPIENRWS